MKRFISILVLSAGLMTTAACGGEGAIDPTATALPTPTSTPIEAQDVTFTELFSSPDRYNGRSILLEGFFFHGFETIVLSEKLEYSGRAEEHLWPQGQKIWIEGSIPKGIYDQLHEQEMLGPIERYGKLRIEGAFEYGASYGHLGGYSAQVVLSEVELLQWSPSSNSTPTPVAMTGPTNLSLSGIYGGVGFTLNWQDNSDNEDGFHVEQNGSEIARLPIDTISFRDEALTGGSSFCYRVRASSEAGFSEYSNEACGIVVWPTLTNIEPVEAAPGQCCIQVTSQSGYLRIDGLYDESSRPFDLYFDGAGVGSIGCYVTSCDGTFTVPSDASLGDHQVCTQGGSCLTLRVVSEAATPELLRWLTGLIQKLENEPVADPPASITRYEYNSQTVYFLPQRCCDIFSVLYDTEGSIIGHPDGGITGQGDGRVPDFLEERSSESVIWRDQRTHDPDLVQVLSPIESVEVLIMKSFPPQYSVVVVSGLPNACVSFGGYRLERDGDAIQIAILNWKPADPEVACPAVYGTVDTTVPLGSDFESGMMYTVVVNEVTETFVAQ